MVKRPEWAMKSWTDLNINEFILFNMFGSSCGRVVMFSKFASISIAYLPTSPSTIHVGVVTLTPKISFKNRSCNFVITSIFSHAHISQPYKRIGCTHFSVVYNLSVLQPPYPLSTLLPVSNKPCGFCGRIEP